MFKPLIAVLLIASTAVFAQPAQEPPEKKSMDGNIYRPTPEYREVPSDHTVTRPKSSFQQEGIGLWCNTLRGTGSIAIAKGEELIFIAIDCPVDIKRDT